VLDQEPTQPVQRPIERWPNGCNRLARGPAITSPGARFLVDFYDRVDRWAAWATAVVQEWPNDPNEAEPTLEVDQYILRLAAGRARRPEAASTEPARGRPADGP
jgi:hypothetical protein